LWHAAKLGMQRQNLGAQQQLHPCCNVEPPLLHPWMLRDGDDDDDDDDVLSHLSTICVQWR